MHYQSPTQATTPMKLLTIASRHMSQVYSKVQHRPQSSETESGHHGLRKLRQEILHHALSITNQTTTPMKRMTIASRHMSQVYSNVQHRPQSSETESGHHGLRKLRQEILHHALSITNQTTTPMKRAMTASRHMSQVYSKVQHRPQSSETESGHHGLRKLRQEILHHALSITNQTTTPMKRIMIASRHMSQVYSNVQHRPQPSETESGHHGLRKLRQEILHHALSITNQTTTPMKRTTIASRHMSQVYSNVQHRPQPSETESGHHGLRKLRQEILHHALSITNQTTTPMKRIMIARRHMSQVYSNVQHRPQSSETESGHHGLRKLRQEILHHALSITNQTTTPMKRMTIASRHMSQVYSNVQHRPQSSETESGHHGLRKLRQEILHHALSITNQTTTPMKRITIASRHMSQVYSNVQHRPQSSETESGHHSLRKLRQEILHHALSITNQTTTPMKGAMTASHHMSQVYSKVQHRPQSSETESGHHGLRKLRQEILHHALSITNQTTTPMKRITIASRHMSQVYSKVQHRPQSSETESGHHGLRKLRQEILHHALSITNQTTTPMKRAMTASHHMSQVYSKVQHRPQPSETESGHHGLRKLRQEILHHALSITNQTTTPMKRIMIARRHMSQVYSNVQHRPQSSETESGHHGLRKLRQEILHHALSITNQTTTPMKRMTIASRHMSQVYSNVQHRPQSSETESGHHGLRKLRQEILHHALSITNQTTTPMKRITIASRHMSQVYSKVQHRPQSSETESGHHGLRKLRQEILHHALSITNRTTTPMKRIMIASRHMSQVYSNVQHRPQSSETESGHHGLRKLRQEILHHALSITNQTTTPMKRIMIASRHMSQVYSNVQHRPQSSETESGHHGLRKLRQEILHHALSITNQTTTPMKRIMIASRHMSQVYSNVQHRPQSSETESGHHGLRKLRQEILHHALSITNQTTTPMKRAMTASHHMSQVYSKVQHRPQPSETESGHHGLRKLRQEILHHALSITNTSNHTNEIIDDCKPPHVSGLFQSATPSAVIRNRIGSSWSQKAATGNPASCIINHQPNNHTNEKNDDCKPPHVPGLFQRATPSAVIRNRIGSSWSQKAATGNPASCIINHQPNNHTNEKSNDCKPPHVSGLFQSATPSAVIRNRIGSSWSQKAATGNPASCIINHQPNNHTNEKNNDCKPPHVPGLFQRATPSAAIRNRIGSSWSQKAATGNPASCIINHQPNNHTNEKNDDCKPPHVPGLFQRATPSAAIRNRIGSSWSQKAATGNPASCIINHQPNNHTNEKNNDCTPPHVSGLFQRATPSAVIRNRIGSSWSQKAATGNPASCIINHQPNNHTNEKNDDCKPPHVPGLFQRATPSAVIRNRIGSSWSQKAATGNPASCIINHQPNNHTNEKNNDCKPPHVPGLFQRATPSAVIRNRIGSS